MTTTSKVAVYTGVPTFLQAQFRTSRKGGRGGYADAGRQLGKHVNHLEPHGLETDEWLTSLDAELDPLTAADDDVGVLAWLDARFPAVMSEVPRQRRGSFLRGFYDGVSRRDD